MIAELEPGQAFAAYRIEGIAGRGGMGIVYRARQLGLDRTVALKLIAPEVADDETFRRRFARESRVLASLDHPNVIAPFEAGEAGGQPYISMRYVEGLDLRQLISLEGALAPDRAAGLVAQVGAALDAAHARGLVHRDVKPSNILVEARGGRERAYLGDFGLSRSAEASSAMTRSSGWVGTLDYVAPEQISDGAIDARTDCYALGCVLFHALTGRVPFPRSGDPAKLWAHLHSDPPSLAEARPGLSPELDRVLATAMAKDPGARYRSCGELGREALRAAGAPGLAADVPVPPLPLDPDETITTGEHPAPAPPAGAAGWPRRAVSIAGGLIAIAAIAIAALLLLGGGDGEPQPAARAASPPVTIDRYPLGGRAVPGNLVADATGVSVLDRASGELIRLDDLGRREATREVGPDPSGIAIDSFAERLFALSIDDRRLTQIALPNGRIIAPTRVQREPAYVAPRTDGGAVVLSSRDDGASLLAVDARGELVGEEREVGGAISDLEAYAGNYLVMSVFPPLIETYDDDFRRVDRFRLRQDGIPGDIAIDGSTAWVTFFDPPRVSRFDLGTGRRIGRPIPVGSEPKAVAVGDGVVSVPSSVDETLTRIDARSGAPLGDPIEIANLGDTIAAQGDTVWLAGRRDVIKLRPP